MQNLLCIFVCTIHIFSTLNQHLQAIDILVLTEEKEFIICQLEEVAVIYILMMGFHVTTCD